MYNIASISLFILLSAQLPRTLNLIFENNLVSFEYFFLLTVNWTEGMQIWHWLLIFIILSEFYFILCMFCIFVCIIFVYFLCQELWLFYAHSFSLSFFLIKYLILLMYFLLCIGQPTIPISYVFTTFTTFWHIILIQSQPMFVLSP